MASKQGKKGPSSNYPASIEEKIGFDRIRELIGRECATDAGRKSLDATVFMTDPQEIQRQIRLTAEITGLRSRGKYFSFPAETSVADELISRTGTEGSILYEDELFLLLQTLVILHGNAGLMELEKIHLPLLSETGQHLKDIGPAISLIDSILDKEGNMRPDASPELLSIQQMITGREKSVRRVLHAKFELARKNGWAGDTEITIRNERLVIPVIAEHKKKIPGFVHDDSQSGKFLYIEPIECFEENNALKELYLEKKKETERILRQITASLALHRDNIRAHLRFTVTLDAVNAKSVFSSHIMASEPEYAVKHDDSELVDARHPLLYLLLSRDNRKPVPLQFHFKKGNYLVLISGPNAGGKSIALKTIGLLQYMYQCGLAIPASPDTKMSVYRNIFIDIGDNQSIENNLSSYSSHLLNMKYFMEHADGDTLYLIDEMGNGTDPAIGSTIAQAILEQLLSVKAIGIVTTHFGNLKNWASNTPGVQNARMLYDLKNLEPLFILEPDKPGSSFAIEVASKAGIDPAILKRARSISRYRQEMDLDELLAVNEKQRKELTETRERMEQREKVLERLIGEYEQLKDSVSENRKSILEDARLRAAELISQANRRIENTIREIKESEADKTRTRKVRNELETYVEKIAPSKEKKTPKEKIVSGSLRFSSPADIKPGMTVKHADYKFGGEILQVKKDEALVLFGQIKLWLPVTELSPSEPDKKHVPKTATFDVGHFNKQKNFRAEIDLRGIRGEEAVEKLDEWLHDAHMLGMFSLRIIHGRGHGILRKLITDHLKSLPFVEHFEHETEQMGGDGVTQVRIK